MHKPPILIFHAPCTDGEVAKWVVENFFGSVPFIGFNHSYLEEKLRQIHELVERYPGSELFCSDIALPPPEIIKFAKIVPFVRIRDHHFTAIEDHDQFLRDGGIFPENVDYCLDANRCGSIITFDKLSPGTPRPNILHPIDIVDRNLIKHPHFPAIAAFLDTKIKINGEEPAKVGIEIVNSMKLTDIISGGNRLAQGYMEEASEILKTAQTKFIDIGKGPEPVDIVWHPIVSCVGRFVSYVASTSVSKSNARFIMICDEQSREINGITHTIVNVSLRLREPGSPGNGHSGPKDNDIPNLANVGRFCGSFGLNGVFFKGGGQIDNAAFKMHEAAFNYWVLGEQISPGIPPDERTPFLDSSPYNTTNYREACAPRASTFRYGAARP
jgi:hypothetical protein